MGEMDKLAGMQKTVEEVFYLSSILYAAHSASVAYTIGVWNG